MPEEQPLIESEVNQLEVCELQIEAALRSFVNIGDALTTIRDSRLYRDEFESFEEYCQTRWKLTKARATQLIVGARLVARLETETDVVPAREWVARELGRVDEEDQLAVWNSAVAAAPSDDEGNPVVTASIVRETASRHTQMTAARAIVTNDTGLVEDQLGRRVPRILEDAYAGGLRIAELARELTQSVTRAIELGELPGGEFINTQEVERAVRQAREEIKFGAYYTSCLCMTPPLGELWNGRPADDCSFCRGSGFITRRVYETLTDEQRQRIAP